MTYGVYSIRDVKTGFLTPSVDLNDDSAIRNFYHAVNASDGVLFSFAQDFSLYRVGEFDVDSGRIVPLVPIVQVADGAAARAAAHYEE